MQQRIHHPVTVRVPCCAPPSPHKGKGNLFSAERTNIRTLLAKPVMALLMTVSWRSHVILASGGGLQGKV